MERKDFLKNSLGFLGASLIVPKFLMSCSSSTSEKKSDCEVWESETEGPFPTKNPSSYLRSDIVGDRTGINAVIKISVVNIDDNCSALKDAIVDIWHCDKDGNYSQYGGMRMQPTDYKSYNFLRGRQVTNQNGLVEFKSIFPGWYQSRATHIHVHIYDKTGKSLKVTQIAFPEGKDSVVELVNSEKSYGYTKGMIGYTYNADDNVFSDDKDGNQIAKVSGSIEKGFLIDANIVISTKNIEEFKEPMGGPGMPPPENGEHMGPPPPSNKDR